MSRQQISYMVPEPLEPLNLEQVKFWLRIMQEHALFIKAGLPCDNTDLIDEAQAFYQEFESLRVRAERVQSDRKFAELVCDVLVLVKEFYVFKRNLLHQMLECKLGGSNFPLLLDHVAREAEYFIRLLDKMKNNKVLVNGATKAQENTFWLRIMADHAKFISQLLDPSERNLITTAHAFSEEFDVLFMQGRDFSSMLQGYPEVASFKRFIQDARAATVRLRDFKRAAEEMIEECRLVGIIPALLADHVRREADHFLAILAMMEKGIIKNMQLVGIEDTEDVEIVNDVQSTCKIFKVMKPEREDDELELEAEQEEQEEESEREEESEPIVIEPEVEWLLQEKINNKSKMGKGSQSATAEQPQFVETKVVVEDKVIATKPLVTKQVQESETKYKWSGKWPRQLGGKHNDE